MLLFSSCQNEEDGESELVVCEVSSDYYGQFSLSVYDSNPLEFNAVKKVSFESNCWENNYHFEVGAIGRGNCGEGYEYITNPFMAFGISLVEFDTPDINPYS